MGDNGDDGRGGGGGLGVKCDERHKQRRWWSGDRAWLGACRQLWVPSLYLNPLAPAASAAAVVAWQVSAALALAPTNSVSEALVAVRAAPQASTSEAAAVVRVRAVRYSSCRAAA